MSASLVGSEMCIRDRRSSPDPRVGGLHLRAPPRRGGPRARTSPTAATTCLLYTSDAADDM
eukprot:3051563-Alexandrium_andersonii.AAC.1